MEWISVKDRLPEDLEHILVIRRIEELFYIPEAVQYLDNQFIGDNPNVCYKESSYRVTHWMPLPKPPNQ